MSFLFFIFLISQVLSDKPNIVIFMADDLGYNDLGSFGSITVSTPNIDTLAYEGLKLTQFYSTAPLCSGSRAALLTGRLPQRTGAYTNKSYPDDLRYRVFYPTSEYGVPTSELTLAYFLKNSGYYTKMIGKWHLGHHGVLPTQHGFDSWLGLPYSHEEGFPGPNPEGWVFPPVPLMRDTDIIEQPVNLTALTPKYNNEAINFIENHATNNFSQPFLLYVAYEQPHVPLFTSAGWNNVSRRGLFGDCVAEMDHSIGLIMNKLTEVGYGDNTLVIFSSDNGAWINPSSGASLDNTVTYSFDGGSNAPNRGGKGSTWEGGSHVPAIIWGMGIKDHSTCMSPITNMDILPTIADIVGFSLPNDRTYDGVSVKKYIFNTNECNNNNPNNRTNDPHIFTYYWRADKLYAMRYYQYKAHWITRNGFGEKPPIYHSPPILFNLEWDPAESVELNTTKGSEYYEILQIMENEYIRATNDVLNDLGIPGFNYQEWRYVPCCNDGFNYTEAEEYWKEGNRELAIWDECICNPPFKK